MDKLKTLIMMDGHNGAGSHGGEVGDGSSEFQPGMRVMGVHVDDGCPGSSLFDCVRSFFAQVIGRSMRSSGGGRVETSTVSASGEDKSTGWYDYDHTILRIPDATTEMPVGEREAVQESYGVFALLCLVLVLFFIFFVRMALVVVNRRKMKRHSRKQYPHSSPCDKRKYTYIGDV